jgi:hypothetical protein
MITETKTIFDNQATTTEDYERNLHIENKTKHNHKRIGSIKYHDNRQTLREQH